jgi:hypothetical protein
MKKSSCNAGLQWSAASAVAAELTPTHSCSLLLPPALGLARLSPEVALRCCGCHPCRIR